MSDLPPPPSNLPPPPPANMAPPPGYVAYGGPGAVYGRFERIRSLTTWLVALLVINLVVQAGSLALQFSLSDKAQDYLDRQITQGRFEDDLAFYLLVSLVFLAVSIAQIVILIIWTYRIAKNLQVLGRAPQSFGPGATVAVNLLGSCTLGILPFFMWRELWKGSDPDTPAGDPSWKQRPVSPLVPIYLALGLAGFFASISLGIAQGFSNFEVGSNTDDLAEQFGDQLASVVLQGLFTLAAAVVFLLFVRQLAQRHMAATNES